MGGEDGQPALLYVVPCTLVPTLLLAWRRKEFLRMWRGQKWPIGDGFMRLEQYDSDEEAFAAGARSRAEGRGASSEMEMAELVSHRYSDEEGFRVC